MPWRDGSERNRILASLVGRDQQVPASPTTAAGYKQKISQRPLMNAITIPFRDKPGSEKEAPTALVIAVRTYSKNTVIMIELYGVKTVKSHLGCWSSEPRDGNPTREDSQEQPSCGVRQPSDKKISASQSITITKALLLRAS